MKLLLSLPLLFIEAAAQTCDFLTHWTFFVILDDDETEGGFFDFCDIPPPCLDTTGATPIHGSEIGFATMKDGQLTHTYPGCTVKTAVGGDTACVPLSPAGESLTFQRDSIPDFVDTIVVCPCGVTGNGDPHIKPWKGPRYFFMGECDTVFHRSEKLDIHIRTTIQGFYSVIEAVALRVGESVLEMEMGNNGMFWINGQELTNDDLPVEIEGSYMLNLGQVIKQNSGTMYELDIDGIVVELRSMKSLMAVSFSGMDASFMEGTGGLVGTFPSGKLLGRDGVTVFKPDGELATIRGHLQPVNNAMGIEWQVRDTDPQLFREIREPAWPNQCIFPTGKKDQRRQLTSASIDFDAALRACAETHDEDTEEFELCVMDVLSMGDLEVAYACWV